MARHEAYSALRATARSQSTVAAAEDAQRALASSVRILPDTDIIPDPQTVVGLDISYAVDSDRVVAAAVLVDYQSGAILEQVTLEGTATFPYIPGLLALREAPLLMQAVRQLHRRPDLLLCDGQGLAHPDRCGLACHLGVQLSLPSIGCAKSHYIGEYKEPGPSRGERSPLKLGDEIVGYALRTQTNVKPVFVSAGHNISHVKACEAVLHLCPSYRVPDPVRHADHISRLSLRDGSSSQIP